MSELNSNEPEQTISRHPIPKQTGLIAYFANNSVAANLLMIFILIMGTATYFFIQKQMFPNIEINYITIDATYSGASPQEIEESILIKIEDSIKDDSIKITKLAQGLPVGGEIEQLDDGTLFSAFKNRVPVTDE